MVRRGPMDRASGGRARRRAGGRGQAAPGPGEPAVMSFVDLPLSNFSGKNSGRLSDMWTVCGGCPRSARGENRLTCRIFVMGRRAGVSSINAPLQASGGSGYG